MPIALPPAEVPVTMGVLAVRKGDDAVLCALGLGSCIGLALVDPSRQVAGLAHVVLPDSAGAKSGGMRFADVAVPELVQQALAAGARRGAMTAWLVGGASMFASTGPGLDIGARNEEAVRAQLKAHRIPVAGAETGGKTGRTVRVLDGGRTILVREAGSKDRPIRRGR